MVKVLHTEYDLPYEWNRVALAIWLKYPNPFSNHVLAGDIISRHVDPSSGCLHSTRLLLKQSSLPNWIRRLFTNSTVAYTLEESIVDPVKKSMTIICSNVSHTRYVEAREIQILSSGTEHDQVTRVASDAKFAFSLGRVAGLTSAVESYFLGRLRENLFRSKQALLYVLDQLNRQKSFFKQ